MPSSLFTLRYNETPVSAAPRSFDQNNLVLHDLVHVLVPDLDFGPDPAAAGNTAAAARLRAAETSNHHLGQILMLQVTYCTAFAVGLTLLVPSAEEKSIHLLEHIQMLQMAHRTAVSAEDSVAEVDSFAVFRQ